MNNFEKFKSLGLEIPFILLPRNVDLQKWAVIACDQFTQDRNYWERVKANTAGSPSTLNMIFPEVFLPDGDADKRIADIHSTMKNYLQENVFQEPKQGFIYIERDTAFQKKRRGLVAAIDLEQYDWKADARLLIRCTEETVEDRLPPRMNIRRGAPLELPHVLLLIDDADLLSNLGETVKKNDPVYKTDLMLNSGSITGWFIDAHTSEHSSTLAFIAEKLKKLFQRSVTRYDGQNAPPFLFAAGDGNHSLAAAKGIWEEYKAAKGCNGSMASDGLPVHPCRYALVEIVNIYDPAIQFEPIHRLVFGIGFDETISLLSRLPDFSHSSVKNTEELLELLSHKNNSLQECSGNCFGVVSDGRYALIRTSAGGIATACLQPLLDNALKNKVISEIDYIHDNEELLRLTKSCSKTVQTGILLPPVYKAGLFETVARIGPLPRKSFSMGHSSEKRFYLECRSLF